VKAINNTVASWANFFPKWCLYLLASVSAFAWCDQVQAAAEDRKLTLAQTEFFENKVRPVLSRHCYKCHSAEATKVKGGLLLDTREGTLKGGDSGPAVIPGDAEKSLLIKAVRYTDPDLQMPPKGEKLSEAQITDLVAWVKMGAPDPRSGNAQSSRLKGQSSDHWAFKPVVKPVVPVFSVSSIQSVSSQPPLNTESLNTEYSNPIDAFILARLDEQSMKFSPPADKRTLIRRVYLDLIGLPPTPEEVQAFLNDKSPAAFAGIVNRLLAMPQYGERWGRHWLDVARYSDTKGEIRRLRDTPLYPFAWTYRDYVIRAFNDDKPYDRFILEQIAADKLRLPKGDSNLAALGFLTLGERFQNNENDIINDRIDVVTKGFLGLTVSCARCHDHMFDPIPTKDYYSLRGIFESSHEPRVAPLIGGDPTHNADYADYYTQRTNLQYQFDALQPKIRRGNQQANREILRERIELQNKIDALELTHAGAPPRAHVLADDPVPKDSPVFIRGEAENKGPKVPRQFLECLSGPNRKPFTIGSGRIELANAIATRSNPLTARVMVNRIWQHHFGEGIVTTPDDFGAMGSAPSHPELLDYLASHFMEHKWSVKEMHRLILASQTWQQSSDNNPRFAQLDPFNRLLWRQNLRRLEFEPMRDSLLAIGGKLDTNVYGKPVPLAMPKGRNFRAALILEPSRRPVDIGYTTRRTIYGYIDRSDLPEVFNHFDFANPDMENGKRHETTVPQQALYLMNSPLVVEQARNVVERRDVAACKTDQEKIARLYEIIYQRVPRAEEVKLGLEFLGDAATPADAAPSAAASEPIRLGKGKGGLQEQRKARREAFIAARKAGVRDVKPLDAWAEYAHALLLANEASFVN
jgi:mono/diheme cytochrome c family protein